MKVFKRLLAAAIALPAITALCLAGCQLTPPEETASPAAPAAAPAQTPQPENSMPVIRSVQARSQIAPLASTEVRCIAEDSDGGELYYSWSIEAGSISGKGDTVIWKAPAQEGHYSIGVTVTDGSGGAATDTVNVQVAAPEETGHAPVITLMVQPSGLPPYEVFPGQDPVKVRQWSTVIFRCKADDPDGDALAIEWTATGGDIDPADDTMEKVYYIAKQRSLQTVMVKVTDTTGRQTEAKITLNVQCCGGH